MANSSGMDRGIPLAMVERIVISDTESEELELKRFQLFSLSFGYKEDIKEYVESL